MSDRKACLCFWFPRVANLAREAHYLESRLVHEEMEHAKHTQGVWCKHDALRLSTLNTRYIGPVFETACSFPYRIKL